MFSTNPSFSRKLDLESGHFLALSKNEQFELLVNLIKQANEEGNLIIDQKVEKEPEHDQDL